MAGTDLIDECVTNVAMGILSSCEVANFDMEVLSAVVSTDEQTIIECVVSKELRVKFCSIFCSEKNTPKKIVHFSFNSLYKEAHPETG